MVFQLAVVSVRAFSMAESRPENNASKPGDAGFKRGAGNGSLGSKQDGDTKAERAARTTRASIGEEKAGITAVISSCLYEDDIETQVPNTMS